MNEKTVSISVIRRLPRYYRYLGMLLHSGVTRISSKELAAQMKVTASQIRQDTKLLRWLWPAGLWLQCGAIV